MRNLTKPEVVAMWLWGKEYANSGLGAVEWYERLNSYRKHLVDDFMAAYDVAPAAKRRDRETE